MALRKAGFLLAAIVPVALIFAVACGDDADTSDSASQASVDELGARVQYNEEMAAVLKLEELGLHDIDDSLQEGKIEPSFAPSTRTAIRVLALTNWSAEFEEDAATVQEHATDLLKALEDENVDEARRHATELHELGHDFTEAVWAVLAKDLPADAGGAEPHDDSNSTPKADGHSDGEGDHSDGDKTPAAEATP